RRDFDTAGTGDSDDHEIVYGAGLNYLLGRKVVFNLNYRFSLQDTFDTAFQETSTSALSALDNLDREFRLIESHRIGFEF
ncbi:MAG: hypothetical protein ACO20W_02425, partial [Anaerohalosphaeraceae bacterium]